MSSTDSQELEFRPEVLVPGIGVSTPPLAKGDKAQLPESVQEKPIKEIQDRLSDERFKVGPVDVDQSVGPLRRFASWLDGRKPYLDRLPGHEQGPSIPVRVGGVEIANTSAPVRSGAITLHRPSKDPELERLVIEAETKIRGLADKVRLRNPTSPPAPSPGASAGVPSGVGLTLEQCRDNARRVEANGARLNGQYVDLASICASAERIQKDALRDICDKVDGLNETLRTFEHCQLPTPENRRHVLDALDGTLRSVEKIVNDAHEQQKALAERVAPLRRENTDVADANSDRRPPTATPRGPRADSRERRPEDAGDGEGDRPPGIQSHLKSDKLAGKESEGEGLESTDPTGVRGQVDELLRRLADEDRESDRDDQPTQHGSAPRSNGLKSLLEMLPLLAITGTMATTPLVGLAAALGPTLAQQRADEREAERDLSSADAPREDKSPQGTPPGAPQTGSVSVQPVNEPDVKTGDLATYANKGPLPVVREPDGQLMTVSSDGKVPVDPNSPDFRGFMRAINPPAGPPVEVAATPPPAAPKPA